MGKNSVTDVTVYQRSGAYMPTVDVRRDRYARNYRYVSMPSLTRLERAINTLGMTVSLDEYGVPTWTREIPE